MLLTFRLNSRLKIPDETQARPLFQRLSQTPVPTYRNLTIQPHLDKFKFNRYVSNHFKVKEATNSISVIRMLHDYIDDEAFHRDLHNHSTKVSCENAMIENIWSHLAKPSNKPVNKVTSSSTFQMDYPLLTVAENQND